MKAALKLTSSEHQDIKRKQEVERLYLEHHQKLIHHIMGRGLPRREAEDVAHEAFVRLLGLEQSNVSHFIRAYLYKIATNLTIDKLRRRARSPVKEASDDEELLYQDPLSCPEQKNQHQQLLDKISISIKQLPDKCQQAFILYKLKGQSYQEISEQMGVSQSMVRKYVLRAIRHCFEELKQDL